MQKLIIGIAPNITVEIESDDVKDVVQKAAFWSDLPAACPICQSPVRFLHRDPKDNDYWGMICTGPEAHTTNFGVFKEKVKGLYYKGDASWTKAIFGRYAIDEDVQASGGAEPQAEKDRLVAEIRKVYQERHRGKFDLEQAVMNKHNGRMLSQLNIAELRVVLEGLKK